MEGRRSLLRSIAPPAIPLLVFMVAPPAAAEVEPIPVLRWFEGCMTLPQPAAYATVMATDCAVKAVDYCELSSRDLPGCLSSLAGLLETRGWSALDALPKEVPEQLSSISSRFYEIRRERVAGGPDETPCTLDLPEEFAYRSEMCDLVGTLSWRTRVYSLSRQIEGVGE